MHVDTTTPSYAHWMLREIHEQPATLRATFERYVRAGAFRAEACAPLRGWLAAAPGEIVIAASGSSRHAGMVAELLLDTSAAVLRVIKEGLAESPKPVELTAA